MGTSRHSPAIRLNAARQLASARLRENFQYVVVAPALPLSTVLADPRGRWQPVMPGSDSALAMGMIHWIMDNQRYNADYLAIPGVQAMQQAGEQSWTNATHWSLRMNCRRLPDNT